MSNRRENSTRGEAQDLSGQYLNRPLPGSPGSTNRTPGPSNPYDTLTRTPQPDDTRSTEGITSSQPQPPQREWYQFLPFFNQGYNDQYAQYQDEYNLWLSDREREYWDPTQVKDRMENAGFNPNQYAGSLAGGASNSSTQAQAIQAGGDPIELVKTMADLKLKTSQARSIDQETALGKQKEIANLPLMEKLLKQAGINLTNTQYMDLTQTMFEDTRERTMEDGTPYTYRQLQREAYTKGEIAKASTQTYQSAITGYDAEIRRKMVDWFEANNLSKFIPLLTGLMKLL